MTSFECTTARGASPVSGSSRIFAQSPRTGSVTVPATCAFAVWLSIFFVLSNTRSWSIEALSTHATVHVQPLSSVAYARSLPATPCRVVKYKCGASCTAGTASQGTRPPDVSTRARLGNFDPSCKSWEAGTLANIRVFCGGKSSPNKNSVTHACRGAILPKTFRKRRLRKIRTSRWSARAVTVRIEKSWMEGHEPMHVWLAPGEYCGGRREERSRSMAAPSNGSRFRVRSVDPLRCFTSPPPRTRTLRLWSLPHFDPRLRLGPIAELTRSPISLPVRMREVRSLPIRNVRLDRSRLLAPPPTRCRLRDR